MIKPRYLLLICAAVAGASFSVRAQCPIAATPRPIVSAGDIPPQLSPASRQVIARLGDSLRTAGLPDQPLYFKAAEGVFKCATEARILSAVRSLAREIGEARSALGASVDDADLVAGAAALHVGATPAMLAQLRETHREAGSGARSLATPLIALADLLTRRVPASAAAAAIDSLVARGAPANDFAALRAAVERDIDAGRTPEASVMQRTQVLLRGLDARGSGRP
jgi:hypothetical protein